MLILIMVFAAIVIIALTVSFVFLSSFSTPDVSLTLKSIEEKHQILEILAENNTLPTWKQLKAVRIKH